MAVCVRCDGPVRDDAERCDWCGDTMILTHHNAQMCNECGELISKRATSCPYCAHRVRPLTFDEFDDDLEDEDLEGLGDPG